MARHTTFFFLFCWVLLAFSAQAQNKYFSKTAQISFDAEGTMDDFEEIKAKNQEVVCIYDAATGNMEWEVQIKKFTFANRLMQQHFNENYMDSEKYPKATFKGKVDNFKEVNLQKDGTYVAQVQGTMTIHGVSKSIKVLGEFIVKNGVIDSKSSFNVTLADYDIKVPTLMMMKIAEMVKVEIKANWQVLKK